MQNIVIHKQDANNNMFIHFCYKNILLLIKLTNV